MDIVLLMFRLAVIVYLLSSCTNSQIEIYDCRYCLWGTAMDICPLWLLLPLIIIIQGSYYIKGEISSLAYTTLSECLKCVGIPKGHKIVVFRRRGMYGHY